MTRVVVECSVTQPHLFMGTCDLGLGRVASFLLPDSYQAFLRERDHPDPIFVYLSSLRDGGEGD